jgi:hypothetical protein
MGSRERSTNGVEEKCIWDIDRKVKGKRQLENQDMWVDNIKIDLREI